MAEFVIHVRDVGEDGRRFEWPIRRAWLGAELVGSDLDAGPEDGRLEVSAVRTGKDIVLTGRARATMLTTCGRCLEEARVHADAELGVLLTARGTHHRPPPDELELTPEEIRREFWQGDHVELDDLVREHLLLEVPMQPLCREDCPWPSGWERPTDDPLAPEGVDPRLAPLLRFGRDD